jgi:hypothetical protein
MLSNLVLDGLAPTSSYEFGRGFILELPLISLWNLPLGRRGFSFVLSAPLAFVDVFPPPPAKFTSIRDEGDGVPD